MSEGKVYRKPYNPPVEATWWVQHPFYLMYILREGTAAAALLVTLEIVFGIFCLALCDLGTGVDTAQTAAPYLWFVHYFLGNPVIMLVNLLCLLGCLFHAVTWFSLMPKAVRVFMNKNSTEMLPDYVTLIGLYTAAIAVTVVILGAAFFTMP